MNALLVLNRIPAAMAFDLVPSHPAVRAAFRATGDELPGSAVADTRDLDDPDRESESTAASRTVLAWGIAVILMEFVAVVVFVSCVGVPA